ncbi:phosphate uptake regulator PhoU [Candidatus Woesearchaeota archaeon]|nr:phosphate uptake regulator PhoU [Candidatus Woesearchaeota archaeon]
METRRIIGFGRNSYVVSVPKEWISRNRLGKKDVLSVEMPESGELIFTAVGEEAPSEGKEIVIELDDKDGYRVSRELVSAYIANYDLFRIVGRRTPELTEGIRRAIEGLMAVETIEQSSKHILAKSYLSVRETKLHDMLRRIDIVIRSMFQDTLACKDAADAKSVWDRDFDINKLSFLIFRLVRGAMADQRIARTLGLRFTDLYDIDHVTSNLEKLADNIKSVAEFKVHMPLPLAKRRSFDRALKDAERLYLDTMAAYYKRDRRKGFDLAQEKRDIAGGVEQRIYSAKSGAEAILYVYLRDILTQTRNVARIVMSFEKPAEGIIMASGGSGPRSPRR